jgi:acetolactate synthase-1/2/3 large subunit
MNTAATIARILQAEGTRYLFCFPVHPLIEECAKIDLRPIVGRTERTIVNMADGYSRVSRGRQLGVVVVQYGPGAENAYAGVAQAFADGSPVLFLPGGFPRGRVDVPPNFDAAANYRGVTKWSARVDGPPRAAERMRQAFALLRSGRPAPVVVELPMDVLGEECPETAYRAASPVRMGADPGDVREATRILLGARDPVLHAGQGVLWADAAPELIELAELVDAPVMTTLPGKSAFPEDHPLSLGTGGYAGTAMVDQFLRAADVVFGIGCSFTSTLFAAPIPAGKTVVQITNHPGDLDKDVPIAQAVLGDAKLVLRQVIDEVNRQSGRRDRQTAAAVQASKLRWLAEWMPKLTSNEKPINPYRVIHELMGLVDRHRTIVTHDAGTPRDQLAPFWEALTPRGYIGWGKSTQLGSSLGLCLGAKLAAPDKLVIQFLGDTAFGMCGMDYETAVRERIPILTVLVNNGLMGGYERYIPIASQKYRSRYLTGDYTKVAEALGVSAERVTEPHEIVPALRRALAVVAPGGDPGAATARPALVEFMTREETNLSKPW